MGTYDFNSFILSCVVGQMLILLFEIEKIDKKDTTLRLQVYYRHVSSYLNALQNS